VNPPRTAVIFLQRKCPRKCPYCDAWRAKDKSLSLEKWKLAFRNLKDFGCDFYLLLGNEPLLLGEKLVELVKFWKAEGFYYAIYSTSPQPYFDQWKDKLVEAGLRNYSAGMDYIPVVYEKLKPKLSKKTIDLVEASKNTLVKKATESLSGQLYMYDKGVEEILSLITISRMNIEIIPEMIEYMHEKVIKDRRWKLAFNYLEFKDSPDNDFAIEKGTSPLLDQYFFTEEDKPIWEEFLRKMHKLEKKIPEQQIPWDYLDSWDAAMKLNRNYCKDGGWQISVDQTGQLRKCGYKTGKLVNKFTVFDLPDKKEEILRALKRDVEKCSCYWALPFMLIRNFDYVRFDSKFWKEKYESE